MSAASAQDAHSRRNTASLWTCLHPGGSPSTSPSSSNRALPSHESLSPVARGGAALVLVQLPEKEERSRAMDQRDQEEEWDKHDRHDRGFGHDRQFASLMLLGGAKCEPICKVRHRKQKRARDGASVLQREICEGKRRGREGGKERESWTGERERWRKGNKVRREMPKA